MFSRFQNNDFWQKNFSGKIDTKKFLERLTHFRIFGGTQNVSIFPGELYLVLDSNYGIPHNISLILDDRNYSIIEIGTSRRIPISIVLWLTI